MILKTITEFENYKISENGRIFNKEGLELKQNLNKEGYYEIGLWKNNKRKTRRVHRLVGQAFLPNFYGKPEVDHKNRIRSDNRLINLKWATHRENMKNLGIYKNNTSGHTNIFYRKNSKVWHFQKRINKKTYTKSFKKIEDAIDYKENKLYLL